MIRAGIRPAAAGAAVLMGTFGSNISPGTSHNSVVAKIANMDMMDLISLHTPYSIAMVLIGAVGLTIVCLILRDNKPTAKELEDYYTSADHSGGIERINPLKAIAPLVPLVILLLGNSYVPVIKMGVAQAMVIGAIFALIVSWVNPQQFTKDFFKGMGEGYGSVMGIIITAGVFAAGLKATGLIDAFVEVLKSSTRSPAGAGLSVRSSWQPLPVPAMQQLLPSMKQSPRMPPLLVCRFQTSAQWPLSQARWAVRCPHCRCCHCAFRFGYGTPINW